MHQDDRRFSGSVYAADRISDVDNVGRMVPVLRIFFIGPMREFNLLPLNTEAYSIASARQFPPGCVKLLMTGRRHPIMFGSRDHGNLVDPAIRQRRTMGGKD